MAQLPACKPEGELVIFKCGEAYVYKVPPASTVGHRAETWDVDAPLFAVDVRVVRALAEDTCLVRLSDAASGEAFAEAPVAPPLQTALEAVVDSSRYFVLRVVDAASGRHAFIGLGFASRDAASDFAAAVIDCVAYLERRAEAAAARAAAAAGAPRAAAAADDGGGGGAAAAAAADLSLRPGERLALRLPGALGRAGSSSSGGSGGGRLHKTFSIAMFGDTAEPTLAPPPPASPSRARPTTPSGGGAPGRGGDWGDFEAAPPAG